MLLLEGGERVLPTFTPKLADKAGAALSRLGVEVRSGALVEDADDHSVQIATSDGVVRISTRTIVWAAGVQASPLGKNLAAAIGVETDRAGRLLVGPDLTIPGHPEIYVAGDLASYSLQTGNPLRGTADVAIAEGRYVGKTIRRRLAGKRAAPFKFRDLGTLAVIGRSAAVADLRIVRFSGRLAWWTWLFIHLMKLVDFQNRLTVFVQWGWSYLTKNRSARLITRPMPSSIDALLPNASESPHLARDPLSLKLPIDGEGQTDQPKAA